MKLFLFDLGGVLIELTGVPIMVKWTGDAYSEAAIWERWLKSPPVRSFESGLIDQFSFARGVIEDFKLPVSESEFLAEFYRWPKGFYDGAPELLTALRRDYLTGCLSNSNSLHEKRFAGEWRLPGYFDYCFFSHNLGFVKPDREIFEAVIAKIPVDRSEIVYFDDNELNANAARECGIESYTVKGFDELKKLMKNICGDPGV